MSSIVALCFKKKKNRFRHRYRFKSIGYVPVSDKKQTIPIPSDNKKPSKYQCSMASNTLVQMWCHTRYTSTPQILMNNECFATGFIMCEIGLSEAGVNIMKSWQCLLMCVCLCVCLCACACVCVCVCVCEWEGRAVCSTLFKHGYDMFQHICNSNKQKTARPN